MKIKSMLFDRKQILLLNVYQHNTKASGTKDWVGFRKWRGVYC